MPSKSTADNAELYELLFAKMHQLREAHILETDTATKFKLTQQIQEAERELATLEMQFNLIANTWVKELLAQVPQLLAEAQTLQQKGAYAEALDKYARIEKILSNKLLEVYRHTRYIYLRQGKTKSLELYLDKTKKLLGKRKKADAETARYKLDQARVWANRGKIDPAIELAKEAVRDYGNLVKDLEQARALINLGNMYRQKDRDEQKNCYEKAIRLLTPLPDSPEKDETTAIANNSLGACYLDRAYVRPADGTLASGDFKKAIDFLQTARELFQKLANPRMVYDCLFNLTQCAAEVHEFELADTYYAELRQAARQIEEDLSNPEARSRFARLLNTLGSVHLEKGNFQIARVHLEEARQITLDLPENCAEEKEDLLDAIGENIDKIQSK